jgi:tRNA(Arg) A34 adenosine deaminase TadA
VNLDHAWVQAFALAWDGYLAGTTPVGAVVVDSAGVVVAEARGRRYDRAMVGRQLSNCHVAHAELNALALLPPDRHYEDHTLLTTLEPCCMCLGAAVQATIISLHYAGRDPYAGTAHLEVDTPQARRRPISMLGPLSDVRGRFAELLHVIWLVDYGASPAVLAEQERGIPEIYAVARRPAAGSIRALRDAAAPVSDAIAASRALLADQ